MMETTTYLGDGIHQIRLPMVGNPLRYVNGYVLEDEGGATLVDCGWKADDVLETLHDELDRIGMTFSDIGRVAITHHHFDHYGLAGTLRRAGVRDLIMHRIDWETSYNHHRDHAAFDDEANAFLASNGFLVNDEDDLRPYDKMELAQPTIELGGGERIGRLVAIWTPGHSRGHVCFHDTRSGKMLSGDHILDPITPHIGMWIATGTDPLGEYIGSLKLMARYGAIGVLPAHGEPFPDLARRAGQIFDHTMRREQQVIALMKAGPVSATDVARGLTWTRRERSFESLGELHQQFAVSETLAHLEHLRAQGAAVCEEIAQVVSYQLVPVAVDR